MLKKAKEISGDLNKLVPYNINKIFEREIPNVINVAIESYEINLLGSVIPRGSLSDPNKFIDDYIESLEAFTYISDNEKGGKTFHTPDSDTFDFSNIGVVKLIIEGVSGNYKELPERDLNKLLNNKEISNMIKRKLRQLPDLFNGTANIRDRFTLVSTRGTLLKTIQLTLGKELVRFPFSNSAPIDLFEDVDKYVEENMDTWVNKALRASTDKIKLLYR